MGSGFFPKLDCTGREFVDRFARSLLGAFSFLLLLTSGLVLVAHRGWGSSELRAANRAALRGLSYGFS